MSVSSSNEGSGRSLPGMSERRVCCVTCKKRKVKCDKGFPCVSCARKQIECVYNTGGKRRTRGPGKQRAGEKIEQMTNRVAQLEQVLGQLQSQGSISNQSVSETNSRVISEPTSDAEHEVQDGRSKENVHLTPEEVTSDLDSTTHLLVKGGKSQYIRNRFWATINEELGEPEDMLEGESYATTSQSHDRESTPPMSNSYNLLFGTTSNFINLAMLRPPTFQMPLYCQLYFENIDVVYKFMHKPSVEKIVGTAVDINTTLSPSNEALLFAIFFAVISSMSAAKVQDTFQDNKETLISRYRCGLERALGRAGLLNTEELSTLQAFIILIICARRSDDSRSLWTLVGLATRLAIGMGLQHDGSKFKISPWETEMRRRIWWQIYFLDVRAAEDQGCEVTIAEDSFDTHLPLNINDDDLDVNATVLPQPRVGLTEMTTAILRSEITALGRLIRIVDPALSSGTQNLTLREKLTAIKACERKIHHKYLQNLRPDVPISIFIYNMAKFSIAKMTLLAHQPDFQIRRDDQGLSTLTKPELSRDELFVMSISILEGIQFLETAPEVEKWAWVSRKYVQWRPLANILMELGSTSRQPGMLVDRAWRAIDNLHVDNVERMADKTNKAIFRPVEKLLEQARRRRAELMVRPEVQIGSRPVGLPPCNLQQFQNVGSTCENFDWYLGAPEGDAPLVTTDDYAPQFGAMGSLPIQDIEFWNDMTGVFQNHNSYSKGAICGGEMSDWW